jgi:hypothetical protein
VVQNAVSLVFVDDDNVVYVVVVVVVVFVVVVALAFCLVSHTCVSFLFLRLFVRLRSFAFWWYIS